MRLNQNEDAKDKKVTELERLCTEYVEADMIQHHNGSVLHRSSSDSLTPLLELQSPVTWQIAEEKWDKGSALPTEVNDYTVSPNEKLRGSYSDSELLNFEKLFELKPNQLRSFSHPLTPRPHSVKMIKKAVSFTDRSVTHGNPNQFKAPTVSSFGKMSQSAFLRPSVSSIWTRELDTTTDSFDFTHPIENSKSPENLKQSRNEGSMGLLPDSSHSPSADISTHESTDLPTSIATFSNCQLTPQVSPATGIRNVAGDYQFGYMDLGFSSSSASSAALSALRDPPPPVPISMTAWDIDASPNLEFAFSASSDYSHTKTAGWWYADLMQPAVSSNDCESKMRLSSQNSAFYASSMIGLGISDAGSFGGPNGMVNQEDDMTRHDASASSFNMEPCGIYPLLSPQYMVPVGHRTLSRTPSPCPQPWLHRRRPSSHAHHHSPRTTSSHRRKSSNGSLSTPSDPRQCSSGADGFVNFTPDDSRKILTGVAPSGSSKTKARRDREAAEKRRKITRAAAQAIIAAGGDLNGLRGLEMEVLLAMRS